MRVIGWRDGAQRVMVTDCPHELMMFGEIMDRIEYVS